MIDVGLNLIFCIPGETGGMEVAARQTIAQLAAIDDLRLTAFVNREAAGTFGGVDEVVVPVNATSRVQWVRGEQQLLPGLAARAGCQLIHSLGSTAPLRGPFKRVTTVHDLNYKLVPESHFGLRGLGMRVLVPAAVRRSHRVLVDATSTRDDLIEHLHAPATKIDVVPLGATTPGSDPTPPEELRARLDLGNRTVLLCVGAKRPHKNAAAVIRALPTLEPRPLLVIPGYRTSYEQVLSDLAAQLGVAADLRLPEPLTGRDLDGLYALAAAVVVPSLYEGFGLPVLEAMARGVPVASSDRASLPEVAGTAALLFDPQDPDQLRDAVQRVLTDHELRARLRAAGRARAASFSWRRTAELTAQSYRRAVAES